MKNWHGIMEILEFNHFDSKGKILYKENNIKNMLHVGGEDFILKTLFVGQTLPANYYLGLDSRSSLSFSTLIADLAGQEPAINGYQRQSVASNNFSMTEVNGHKQANSPVVLFRATNGTWGPVRNIFLCNGLGYNSTISLISSASLSNSITVADGEIITMKMGMLLSNC